MTGRWWAVEHHMRLNYQVLFNVCWGFIQLRTIIYICRSLWCNERCIVLNIEGRLLLGSETYPDKASLSDPVVSMSTCNIMQRIVDHIFLPLFPYWFLHIVISVFSSVEAWGIMTDESWTGRQWQHLPCVCWLLAEINGSTSIYSSKAAGLAWIYLRNGTSSPHSHLMNSPRVCQTQSWLTSSTGVNRFREALNGTGKWGDFIVWGLHLPLYRKLLNVAYNCRWWDNC